MADQEVRSFEEFHRVVVAEMATRGPAHDRAVFRGEPRPDYLLRPAVGRLLERLQPGTRREWERRVFRTFVRRATAFLDGWRPASEWDWLALAQHHGLPTRLLDWTHNPLVALYFAVAREQAHKEGAVVYVCRPGRSLNPEAESPFAITTVRKFSPPHMAPRIAMQSGIFTVHPEPELVYKPEHLVTLRIPGDARKVMRRALYDYGVTAATLYPGLDGLAEELKSAVVHGFVLRPEDLLPEAVA
jgi:hypothetical protein